MPSYSGCGSLLGAWYCVQSYYDREAEVNKRLEQQGFVSFLPTCIEQVKANYTLQPYFQRYLFSYFDIEIDNWKPIAHTPGVKRIIGTSNLTPTRVPSELINALIAKADNTGLIMSVTPRTFVESPIAGDTVKVLGKKGSFLYDVEGLVVRSGKERVKVLVEFMNRTMEVEMPITQVQKI